MMDHTEDSASQQRDGDGGTLDIAASRRARAWTWSELLARALWEILRVPLFAWSPRICWGWRRIVLRAFGANVGRGVHVYPTAEIAVPWNIVIGDDVAVGDRAILYSLGLISIGPRATISQFAHLCAGTHDHRRADFPLVKASITVGAEAWVCADAYVGPGVSIGPRAIVGARGVVLKDVPADQIVAGNPARLVGRRPPVEPV